MIVWIAAAIALTVIIGGQLVRVAIAWRERRARRRRAEAMLERHLARHEDPPPHVRRLERHEWGFGPWRD